MMGNRRLSNLQYYILGALLLLFATDLSAQDTVSGSVADEETGEVLPGVNILVKGTSSGTTSGSSGDFELTVPSLQDTLVFSYIGYAEQQIPIDGRTEITVSMVPQALSGEEVVVIGYGTVAKSDLTGSVSSVDAEDVTSVPTTNVAEALQGKVSGMDITRSSVEAGGGGGSTLRGRRTMRGSSR